MPIDESIGEAINACERNEERLSAVTEGNSLGGSRPTVGTPDLYLRVARGEAHLQLQDLLPEELRTKTAFCRGGNGDKIGHWFIRNGEGEIPAATAVPDRAAFGAILKEMFRGIDPKTGAEKDPDNIVRRLSVNKRVAKVS